MNPKASGRIWSLALAAGVIALDQLSKAWALSRLGAEGVSYPLLPWLDATLVLNRSNAFGVVPVQGDISRWGLAVFNLLVAAALIWWVCRRPRRASSWMAAAFLIAGAAGNAIDRIRLGQVIDFLDLSRIGFHWVFNLADASVDAGIGFMILSVLTDAKADEGRRSTTSEPGVR